MAKFVFEADSIESKRHRAAEILAKKAIIVGSIVEMVHTCGKPGCRCASGEKHVSPYLATRRKGKRIMVSIPRDQEVMVRQWVADYKELMKFVDALSTQTVNDFIAKKKRGA